MHTPITLIKEDLFKLHSPITNGADITDFIPYLFIAQELHIKPILGEPLIEELKSQIQKNELTKLNSDLIVRIAPVLSFFAVYQGLPFHWASIVNKGVTIRESENSKGIDIKDLAQLRRWIRDDAEIFTKLLIDFLCSCKSSYPLWRPAYPCCDEIINEGSTKNNFESGFYFPKRDNGCGCDR